MEKKIYVELKEKINDVLEKYKRPDYGELVTNRVVRLLDHNKIKIKKPSDFLKPNVQKIFWDKTFIYKRDEIWWWGFEALLKEEDMDFDWVEMFKIKTTMGTVYVKTVYEGMEDGSRKKRYQCFTAHFMERIQQRMGLKTIDHAVKKLMDEYIRATFMSRPLGAFPRVQNGRKSVFMPMTIGGALGEKFNDIVLMKTFITVEQYDEWQGEAMIDWLTSVVTDLEKRIEERKKPEHLRAGHLRYGSDQMRKLLNR